MGVKDSTGEIGQRNQLAQQLLKCVKDAILGNQEIEVIDQFWSSFQWLPYSAEPGKTLAHTVFDAIAERNLTSLRQHPPRAKMPKRCCVEIYRRLAFHFGYIADTALSGPKLYEKFRDGWSVLAAWAAATDTSLVILEKTESPALANAASRLTQNGLGAEVVTATESTRSNQIEQIKRRNRAFILINLNDAETIADQFSSGSSESSWKHYRTEGLRLMFGAMPDAKAQPNPGAVTPRTQASGRESAPAKPISKIAQVLPESLHDLCHAAALTLSLPKVIERPEMMTLQEQDQVLVYACVGNGCTTLLKHAVLKLAKHDLFDALYIDLAEPRLSSFVTHLPCLVLEALRPFISTADPKALQEEIRRALATGWLKLFFDNSDKLTAEQRNALFEILPSVPKWALAVSHNWTPNHWQVRGSAIPKVVLAPPREVQVKAYLRECLLKSRQGPTWALLQQHNWLARTWLGLSTSGQVVSSCDLANTTQIAESYWNELLQCSPPHHSTDQMIELLGELTLTQIFMSGETMRSGFLALRREYAENFRDKLSLPMSEVDICLSDWAQTGFICRAPDNSYHLLHRKCATILGGIGYAHWYAQGVVSLFRSTNNMQWQYCVPRSIEYLENHQQQDALKRFCHELTETCIVSRRHSKSDTMTAIEFQTAACLTHMSSALLKKNECLAKYIGDALEREMLRIVSLGKGMISKMVLSINEREAYLARLIVSLAGFDSARLALLSKVVLSHSAARKDKFIETAGTQMFAAAKKPDWFYRL